MEKPLARSFSGSGDKRDDEIVLTRAPPSASASDLSRKKQHRNPTRSNTSRTDGSLAATATVSSAASTTAPSTRGGFNPHKVYIFFFVLVFTAAYSIYQSSYSSVVGGGELGHFAPYRLDRPLNIAAAETTNSRRTKASTDGGDTQRKTTTTSAPQTKPPPTKSPSQSTREREAAIQRAQKEVRLEKSQKTVSPEEGEETTTLQLANQVAVAFNKAKDDEKAKDDNDKKEPTTKEPEAAAKRAVDKAKITEAPKITEERPVSADQNQKLTETKTPLEEKPKPKPEDPPVAAVEKEEKSNEPRLKVPILFSEQTGEILVTSDTDKTMEPKSPPQKKDTVETKNPMGKDKEPESEKASQKSKPQTETTNPISFQGKEEQEVTSDKVKTTEELKSTPKKKDTVETKNPISKEREPETDGKSQTETVSPANNQGKEEQKEKVVKDTQPKANTPQEDKETTKQQQSNKKPLNIVILYADDWRYDDLGVASNGLVHTPFLDFLSTQGIRFTHNCVTTSVCWISRATLHTGQYYSRHKAARPVNNEWYEGFNNTFPALLHRAGYHVGHIGKWHSADFGQIKHHFDLSKIYYGKHWFPGNPRPIHVTERNERDALDMLKKRPKDKPFVMTVAFYAPHSWDGHPDQYLPQNETFHLYQDLNVTPKIDMEASFKRLPKFFNERNEGRYRFRKRYSTLELYDRMMKNYWRLISGVDAACEKIWKELEAQGILDETMIIFTTDNGYYHGEHGLAGKWYPHEESIRVPLIIYDPRMPPNKKGAEDDNFTLNIDLAPTILDAAGIPKPDTYQGRDIADLYLRGRVSPPWRTEFYYEHPVHIHQYTIPASSALVRKNIKYVNWPNFDVEQIFNLTSDPVEEEDQIKNPEYAGIYKELKARHDELRDVVAQERTEL